MKRCLAGMHGELCPWSARVCQRARETSGETRGHRERPRFRPAFRAHFMLPFMDVSVAADEEAEVYASERESGKAGAAGGSFMFIVMRVIAGSSAAATGSRAK